MSRLVLTADNHNSVNGIREFARARGAATRYVGLSPDDLRADGEDVAAALGPGGAAATGGACSPIRRRATSAASGIRWRGWITPRPPATTCCSTRRPSTPTSRLDLAAVRPEFVTVSFYKMFGYPTGVGCLLARRDALARLRRPWFSGGTLVGASVQGGWHRLADDESAFEDGTLNFLAIPDVTTGLAWVSDIGIDLIHRRVS